MRYSSRCAYVIHHQLFVTVLSSELPDAHLDEILESGVHVDVLVLQLAVTGPELHLLNEPEQTPMSTHTLPIQTSSRKKKTTTTSFLSNYLTTSMDAAPALKKSVESWI